MESPKSLTCYLVLTLTNSQQSFCENGTGFYIVRPKQGVSITNNDFLNDPSMLVVKPTFETNTKNGGKKKMFFIFFIFYYF